MTTCFRGIWPAMLTPIASDGRPALDVLERLTDLFVRDHLDGLYVVGSTGQWPLLTREERCAITECAVRVAAGRIPVMVHVGAATTADAVLLAQHAARTGADAVSAVTPIYYGYSNDAVFEYYRRIGAATDLPLFVYHLSGISDTALGARAYVDRLLAVPNIAGMKVTIKDLHTFGLIHSYGGGRLQLFSGADEVMCHAVLSGAVGAIGTFYNVWGPACKRARQAFAAGSIDQGSAFMLRFQSAIDRVLTSGALWSFLRAAMRLKYGIDVGMPRPPLGAAETSWRDDEVRRLIDEVDSASRG